MEGLTPLLTVNIHNSFPESLPGQHFLSPSVSFRMLLLSSTSEGKYISAVPQARKI